MRSLPFAELLTILSSADSIRVIIPKVSLVSVLATPRVITDDVEDYGQDEPFFTCTVHHDINNSAWEEWLTVPESTVTNCIITDNGDIRFDAMDMHYTITVLQRVTLN